LVTNLILKSLEREKFLAGGVEWPIVKVE
jgi:hypothetical protein